MFKRLLALLALGCAANAVAFPIPRPYPVIEYVNADTGRYRLVALPYADITALDEGGEGGRWVRTGYAFHEIEYGGNLVGLEVCHFYNPSHDAHYYTPHTSECTTLKRPGSGWAYQGGAFAAPELKATGCASGSPVRRLWDGGVGFRFSSDPAIIERMLSRGWTDEGIGFCAHGSELVPERSFAAAWNGQPPEDLSRCEAREGPCAAQSHLPLMTTPVPRNDAYLSTVRDLIGISGTTLYTSGERGPDEVLQHSFYMGIGSAGVHLVGSDRLSGPYASLSPMYQFPQALGPHGDKRVFPWRGGHDRDLVIGSHIAVPTLTRANPSSDAYGLQLIHFADVVSGRRFYVTLQAFGVSPGGDYIGADFSTGRAIVSTSYRENPLFGQRISGNATRCDVDSVEDCLPMTLFRFRISKADFQKVLGHARLVDPLLTPDPANYTVSSIHQYNETYLDATIGMTVHSLTLQVWPRAQ